VARSIDSFDLRTPTDHGGVLIAPPADSLARTIAANRALFDTYDFRLLDRPVAEARAEARAACGVTDERLVVMTGHQPDFIHAGVWAKYVVAARLADSIAGHAVNLAVDNDAPKDFAMRVPAVDAAGRAEVRVVPYAVAQRGSAIEFLPAQSSQASRAAASAVQAALGARWERSLAPMFFSAYGEPQNDWVEQSLAGRHAVEAEFGIHVHDVRVSQAWGGAMLGDMLANARRFAAAYNGALQDYRTRYQVRAVDRPAPDLFVDGARCELALWAYRPGEPRRRVFMEERGAHRELRTERDVLVKVPPGGTTTWREFAESLSPLVPWVLRPRALTLTLWARMLASDLFIHGIGGAKYDRATDELIRRYYGVAPPAMACVSATLQWSPEAAASSGTVAQAQQQLRDFQFNPQRHIDSAQHAAMLAARTEAVAESARLRKTAPHDRRARRVAFEAIRRINAQLAAAAPEAANRLADDIARAERDSENARILRGREYFFALHPRQDLELLLARLPQVQAARGSTIV
jgi:hypothetical protein